jgi:hypothetical protein
LPIYKLYVSVRVIDLSSALLSVGQALSSSEAAALKVARTLRGALRPDKIVIYSESWNQLQRIANHVDERLRGLAAQGVPFAARYNNGGLLFWGIDPPRTVGLAPWLGISWRKSVTDLVSAALVNCAGSSFEDAVHVVRQRCRLAGVDPLSWSPSELT